MSEAPKHNSGQEVEGFVSDSSTEPVSQNADGCGTERQHVKGDGNNQRIQHVATDFRQEENFENTEEKCHDLRRPGRRRKESTVSSSSTTTAKLTRAPGAPKRSRTPFILFSAWKHRQIRQELSGTHDENAKMINVAKMVADAWKALSSEDKSFWAEQAAHDKERYLKEKSEYTGPWKVAVRPAPTKDDPSAPKRPVPAFLAYSNSKRAMIKRMNPGADNGKISRIVAAMWKKEPEEVRQRFIQEAAEKREKYKTEVEAWQAALNSPYDVNLMMLSEKAAALADQSNDRVEKETVYKCSEPRDEKPAKRMRTEHPSRPVGFSGQQSVQQHGMFDLKNDNAQEEEKLAATVAQGETFPATSSAGVALSEAIIQQSLQVLNTFTPAQIAEAKEQLTGSTADTSPICDPLTTRTPQPPTTQPATNLLVSSPRKEFDETTQLSSTIPNPLSGQASSTPNSIDEMNTNERQYQA